MATGENVTVHFIHRTPQDRVGQRVELHYFEDHLIHSLPYRVPVYDAGGRFVGEVVAEGGVWKPTLDGTSSPIPGWDRSLYWAVRHLGLMSTGELDHGPYTENAPLRV